MSLIVILGFCVLMVLAIPVGHALIIAAAGAILWWGAIPVMAVAQTMFQQIQSFPMLALPFFMLAGALMMGGRLGQELLHFATEGMKRWRGGSSRPRSSPRSPSAASRAAPSPTPRHSAPF